MKQFLLSICCVLFCGSAYSQSKVIDFVSAMTSAPVDKKVSITNVNYDGGGAYESVEKRSKRLRKATRSVRNKYAKMGHIIDSLGLINYRADTLYVLSVYYTPTSSVSEYFKFSTRNDQYFFVRDASGGYVRDSSSNYIMSPLENQYDSHADPRIIASDSLFHNTIFSWDIDKLIQMIKVSGGSVGGEYFMSATRIILQDNRVIAKDIVNFKPALLWYQ